MPKARTASKASLEKLVDVLLAENISERPLIECDLALVKVQADQQSRPYLMELTKVFRARVIDVASESLILEVSGTVDKIDGLLEALRPFGVLEMARSSSISVTRGNDLRQGLLSCARQQTKAASCMGFKVQCDWRCAHVPLQPPTAPPKHAELEPAVGSTK